MGALPTFPASAGHDTSLPGLKELLASRLAPAAAAIDAGELYPADLLRQLGALGVFRQHLPRDGAADLWPAIEAMAAVGEVCGATAFMTWCQDTLAWYVANSANAALRDSVQEAVASGRTLGGTDLSNPMKSFFGIETLKLAATPIDGGGVSVRGALPWVSNLGPGHLFGTIAAGGEGSVMVLAECGQPGLQLTPCAPFLGMDGTGTYALQFRDCAVPTDRVIADPAMPFVLAIRAGFVLLQTGMGLGLVRDCASIMREVRPHLEGINGFLDQQPELIEADLDTLRAEIRLLAATPYEGSLSYWTRVVRARLDTSELCLRAAQAAMLHAGARGYVKAHRAQRRLREAYFVAIVTPATKQLRKMLALAAAEAADAAA